MTVIDCFENRPDEITLVLTGVEAGAARPAGVVLNEEHELNLFGGNRLLRSFQCSPASLGELCAGWLLSEGYGGFRVEVAEDGASAVVQGALEVPAQPDKLGSPCKVSASPDRMLRLFHQASDKYERSHGIHECVIQGNGWHILRTDIGRHNAIDKALGAAVLAGYDLTGGVMFTSGRINVQTVKKAVRCGIGCLMSKAVITRQALLLAEELGLQVLFSVKQGSYMTK